MPRWPVRLGQRDSPAFPSLRPPPFRSSQTHKDQRPKTARPAHAPFCCATVRKTAETREHRRRESDRISLRFRAKTEHSAPPTQNCPHSLPPQKLVSPLAVRAPLPGLALTPHPCALQPLQLHTPGPEVRADFLKRPARRAIAPASHLIIRPGRTKMVQICPHETLTRSNSQRPRVHRFRLGPD